MFFHLKDEASKKGKPTGKPDKKVHYLYCQYKMQVAD